MQQWIWFGSLKLQMPCDVWDLTDPQMTDLVATLQRHRRCSSSSLVNVLASSRVSNFRVYPHRGGKRETSYIHVHTTESECASSPWSLFYHPYLGDASKIGTYRNLPFWRVSGWRLFSPFRTHFSTFSFRWDMTWRVSTVAPLATDPMDVLHLTLWRCQQSRDYSLVMAITGVTGVIVVSPNWVSPVEALRKWLELSCCWSFSLFFSS